MPLFLQTLPRPLAVLFGLALALPSAALAQTVPTAPVIGDHYERASDTGGAVNSAGGYGASVPLDLPAARGGLPVPVNVVRAGSSNGAAGPGWDVPLSFIRHDGTIAHRRPVSAADSSVVARDRYSLTMDGSPIELVQADSTSWVARRGSAQLKVSFVTSSGTFEMYDGNGRKYVFTSDGTNLDGSSVGPLDNGNLYLLRDIFGAGGLTHVHLDYAFATPSVGGGTALSIDLTSVSYNFDPTGACPKHVINLNYGPDNANGPLSITMLGSTALVRMHLLANNFDTIHVMARESAANPPSPHPCSDTTMRLLRRYAFFFQAGGDLGQLQLQSVSVLGQENTAENGTLLPVASYVYGQFTDSNGTLSYAAPQIINLPSDFNITGDGIFGTAATQALPDPGADPHDPAATDTGSPTYTLKGFYDVNGDGRPDIVYGHGTSFTSVGGRLALATPQPGGTLAFADAGYFNPSPTSQPDLDPRHVPPIRGTQVSRSITTPVGAKGSKLAYVQNLISTQIIDMNGDGRPDVLTSEESQDNWVLYLNTPDPDNANNIVWKRSTIPTATIRQHLTDAGLTLDPGQPVPLSRSFTSKTITLHNCWQKVGSAWQESLDGYTNGSGACQSPQGDDPSLDTYGIFEQEGETTIVEWRLQDVNGDKYPDLIYNGAPVTAQLAKHQPPSALTTVSGFVESDAVFGPVFPGQQVGDDPHSTDVRALINVAGVQLDTATNPFSAPVILEDSAHGCGGVEKWLPGLGGAPFGQSVQVCGLADINGDGLADRVKFAGTASGQLAATANLGTGNLTAPFGAQISLPGPVAIEQRQIIQTNDNTGTHFIPPPNVCPIDPNTHTYSATATYPQQRIAGFSDLNGDGKPDYITGSLSARGIPGSATWFVYFGTGAGFSGAVLINNLDFQLSAETVNCSGLATNTNSTASTGTTTAGFYDLDGDGVPEFVQLSGPNTLTVKKLSYASNGANLPQPPVSGRLTSIGNGYGGFTNIAYGSAKVDGSTAHFLPYPEVVVTEVATQDAAANSPVTPNNLVSPVFYAYGGASQIFDAASDRWVFPGYQRKVALQTTSDPGARTNVTATVTDSYPLAPFADPTIDATARFLRNLKAGRTSDVTTLAGDSGSVFPITDPSLLLAADITIYPRIAASHMDYTARVLGQGLGPLGPLGASLCVDMVVPYDFHASNAYAQSHQSFDQCLEYGFALQTSLSSYRGTPGNAAGTADVIVSPQIVQSASSVTAFNDFGRVTDSVSQGDLADNGTKLCAHVDYATPPQTSNPTVHVLNAVAQQTVQDCNGVTLAKTRFEYDGFTTSAANPVGQVSNGFVTSSTVTRYDENHGFLSDIRQFDSTYNFDGTLHEIKQIRDDGAVKKVQFSYEPFGLVATGATSTAYDPIGGTLPALTVSSTPDSVTLNVTRMTDVNGMVWGKNFDGFGRVRQSLILPPGTPIGTNTPNVLSSIAYNGFEFGASTPRSIVKKVFPDAVSFQNIDSAPGRTGTVLLDSLGRATQTNIQLGADYQNQTVVAGERTYDLLGRVKFMADPILLTDNFAAAYGTTYNYNADGTPSCFVRGTGVQPADAVLDETNEIYPSCINRNFANNQEVVDVSTADATLTQAFKRINLNAMGRVLERSTQHHAWRGNTILNDVVFTYDALGHMTSMTRYQDPINKVTTTWHFDSLGWLTRLDEDGVASQTRTFDSWGNLTMVQQGADSRTITRYDGYGRPVHSEDQASTCGQPVPCPAADFSYDFNGGAIAGVPRNNVLGRLASATWSTGQEWFTYDSFGQVNSRSFTDTGVTPNAHYYEIHERHDNGSENILHLALPDTNSQDERVTFAYDTAGRVNSEVYSSGGSSQMLFANPSYDPFGRLTAARYGLASFNAAYAATGRRLLNSVSVVGTNYVGSVLDNRALLFQPLAPQMGISRAYDPMGRKRAWFESRPDPNSVDGDGVMVTGGILASYDSIGRLSQAGLLGGNGLAASSTRSFTYDALGNLTQQTDASTGNPGSVSLFYQAPDLERVCSLAYGNAQAAAPCNVAYNGAGNIISQPTRTGTRTLQYFPNGAVSTIQDGGSNASFTYDAFGALQQLTVGGPADVRADKYFGAFIKQRKEGAQSVLARQIPLPGLTATRHGPTGGWTFAFGDGRGARFATDQTGAFVQDIDYQPFGEVRNPTGATPGSTNYTSEQWNGGDLLAAFGLVKLGARFYDPVTGRFLSRDPIIGKNPYAFASNDPINRADPTGLDDPPPPDDPTKITVTAGQGPQNDPNYRPDDSPQGNDSGPPLFNGGTPNAQPAGQSLTNGAYQLAGGAAGGSGSAGAATGGGGTRDTFSLLGDIVPRTTTLSASTGPLFGGPGIELTNKGVINWANGPEAGGIAFAFIGASGQRVAIGPATFRLAAAAIQSGGVRLAPPIDLGDRSLAGYFAFDHTLEIKSLPFGLSQAATGHELVHVAASLTNADISALQEESAAFVVAAIDLLANGEPLPNGVRWRNAGIVAQSLLQQYQNGVGVPMVNQAQWFALEFSIATAEGYRDSPAGIFGGALFGAKYP
jgi:RHS repeat-associated protein